MHWDIFCKVIDNYGDIGVCWRLAADLAARGDRVRLWVDDASALGWMAPDGAAGVEVRPWSASLADGLLHGLPASDVWIEAFGCDIAPEFVAHYAQLAGATGKKPVWINLEYLTAEAYAARCHGLPSPVMHGPARGWTKWFFYPGFTADTGGLLREPGLTCRAADFDRDTARTAAGVGPGELLFTLFCYEPPALAGWLHSLETGGEPAHVVALPGRPATAVRALYGEARQAGALRLSYPAARPQSGFDDWLRQADLNIVRGEDSLVRALWAGRPFVWHIYPQDDGAHAAKLDAFFDWMRAPDDLRRFHQVWNGLRPGPLPHMDLPGWAAAAAEAGARARAVPDLTTQLRKFVAERQ